MVNEKENSKILTKPLPQILDEMETIIKAAAEASQRAEEAALKARGATDALLAAVEQAKKVPISWEMIIIIIITVLSSIVAAMAVTLGLSLGIVG